jgi:hypothetical protein
MHDVFIVSLSISDINDTECHYGECRIAIKRVDKTKAKKKVWQHLQPKKEVTKSVKNFAIDISPSLQGSLTERVGSVYD